MRHQLSNSTCKKLKTPHVRLSATDPAKPFCLNNGISTQTNRTHVRVITAFFMEYKGIKLRTLTVGSHPWKHEAG